MPLPTGTVPKITAGLYHHVVEDPLATDPVHGNPDLQAERAWQAVVGQRHMFRQRRSNRALQRCA